MIQWQNVVAETCAALTGPAGLAGALGVILGVGGRVLAVAATEAVVRLCGSLFSKGPRNPS